MASLMQRNSQKPEERTEPPDSPHSPNSQATTTTGDEIASLLLHEGSLTPKQLAYAKRVQSKLATPKTLLTVLQKLQFLTDEQLRRTLRANQTTIRLGELLVELGHISQAELEAALSVQRDLKIKKKLGEILIENRFIDERKLAEVLAYQFGFLYVEPDALAIDPQLASNDILKWCTQYVFIPVTRQDGKVVVAFRDPLDRAGREVAEKLFGRDLVPAITTEKAIREATATLEGHTRPAQVVSTDETSAVGIVDLLLMEALHERASDIHIESMQDRLRVRFRCDGVLMHHKDLRLDVAAAISSRLKVMAKADVAETRQHQEGRILFQDPRTGTAVDMRASFFISVHGETVVLRMMSKQGGLPAFKDIGMAPKMLERFRDDALDVPSGVIIISGPTGSGKTTTLYSCVNHLNDIHSSIITAEDPVEFLVDGITQCSINPKFNLTFEDTLRHIVGQDPDVIVLGEIRDRFSAVTSIQAALTGHKVLTTLHTEDSVGGLLRLMNMDIEPFLISSTLVCVVAQRLLRKICAACAEPYVPAPIELRRLGYGSDALQGTNFMRGRGCPQCRFSGYRGRIGIFELLILNELVKEAILSRKTSYEIRRISLDMSGLVTLIEDGVMKAARGETTLEEAIRHLPRLHKPRPLIELRRLLGGA
jgi:type IV pilus assembly protein PilB